VALNVQYQIEYKSADIVAHITIENPTDDLAFFIHLKVTRDPHGEDVLPILWNDNYFSLLPGENKEVHATFAAKDLNGTIPTLEVGGWNIISDIKILGDIDDDGDVDASDLSDLSEAYGSDTLETNCNFYRDNKVDILDLFLLGKNYGKTV